MFHPSTPAPNTQYSLEMVYDPIDGYVVAVTPNVTGGLHNATYGAHDITWSFSGGNWTILTTTGAPPDLLYPGLVYDAADGYTLLWGGYIMAGTNGVLTEMAITNDSWSFVGGTWTNRTSTVGVLPPADSPPILAYDGTDREVVLFDYPATWSYAAGNWTLVNNGTSGSGLPPIGGEMAYDAADGYVVYFGGITSGVGPANWSTENTTWEFSAGAWTNVTTRVAGAPSGRAYEAIAYDPARSAIVVFGGNSWNGLSNYSYQNDTWAYSAGTWSNLNLTTSGTTWYSPVLAFDGATGDLVLAGDTTNATNSSVVSSVWLLGAGTWSVAAPLLALITGGADVGVPFDLTTRTAPHEGALSYRYSDLPPGCVGTDSATLRCTPQAPGRYLLQVVVTDTAGFSVTLTSPVLVNPAPRILSFGATVPVSEVGDAFGFAATAAGGSGSLNFTYHGLPAGCASADSAAISCTPQSAGPATVTLLVTDGIGVTDSATVSVVVAARPTVSELTVSPRVVDQGQSVVVAALTAGGIGPFSYGFGGLPDGCTSVDALSFACVPTSTGTFAVAFTATDAMGTVAVGAGSLVVNPRESITSFGVSAGHVSVGGAIGFDLEFSGGTAPYTIVYEGLPAGCSSEDAAVLQCEAAAPGNYTVTAFLSDATGAAAVATVSVEVATPTVVLHHPPVGSGSVAGVPAPGLFIWGIALGLGGLAISAVWAARSLKARREGEAIVARLRLREGVPTPKAAGSITETSDP